jgi:hypothetical protein
MYANSLDEIDPNIYESAEDKLATLAVQLGESCLTNDLAALMNQKRDFELVESARKGKRPQRPSLVNNKPKTVIFEPNSTEVPFKKQRLRLVLLNAISALLTVYPNEEARFLKQPTILFNCYFTSSQFRKIRAKQRIVELIDKV